MGRAWSAYTRRDGGWRRRALVSRAHAIIVAMGTPAVDIERLSREEQLELLDQLWESLGRDPGALPLSEDQLRDLDQRLDELDREGPTGVSWDEAVRQIRAKPKAP